MITREEAINALKEIKDRAWGWHINEQVLGIDYDKFIEIMDAVLSFLDPVSREQVEKVWRGEWDYPTCEWNLPKCPKCGCNSKDAMYGHKSNFCPRCGEAMTDEAADMVMARLEELHESIHND